MNIIDTSGDIGRIFEGGTFDMNAWEAYMDKWVPGARELCTKDMQECLQAGYTWENDYLPTLNTVQASRERLKKAVASFRSVTEHLSQRIRERFCKDLDADVVLYLGLCNGAGWVTEVNGRTTVLLGVEKIIELDWCDTDSMNGLIVHELGHVYQEQYGRLHAETEGQAERFLWQLFTEGVAMVFEQEVIGDAGYFHQDRGGWKEWCESHEGLIRSSFYADLDTMTRENQRYFGDWVSFEGYGDVGYYLGTRFVRFLMKADSFDRIIGYEVGRVKEGFEEFMRTSI
ncbi:MAG: hypothetical protein J5717_10345 [Lachnospiraceae bacterium]|nr:hypothetical protein [Lachnospiraceae bacterium]